MICVQSPGGRWRVAALSIAPTAREWLRHATGARVLHVFERACNLVNSAGEVVSLVSPELREGPFAIVVPLEVSFSCLIDVDSHVAVQDPTLDVGDLRIDASTAREWNPRPRWEDARRALSSDLIDELCEWLSACAPSDSLAQALFKGLDFGKRLYLRSDSRLRPGTWRTIEPAKACIPEFARLSRSDIARPGLPNPGQNRGFGNPLRAFPDLLRPQKGRWNRWAVVQVSVIEAARRPIAALQAGITRGDPALCRSGTHGLAGLGFGLTPAGDDFLLGAMVAIWSAFPSGEAAALAGSIAVASAPLTTRLSAAWLQAAARGEVAAPWHDLLAGVTARSRERVLSAAERILDMGHTSGADALAGLAAGLIAVGQTTTAPLNFDL